MTKLFNVVGVSSVRAGSPLKLRVANGKPERRARILERNGHAGVALFTVEPAVTKEGAIAFLQANHADLAAQLKVKAVKATVEVETPVETVAEVPVTETVELTAEQKLAAKRARDAARKREKRAAEKAAKAA